MIMSTYDVGVLTPCTLLSSKVKYVGIKAEPGEASAKKRPGKEAN